MRQVEFAPGGVAEFRRGRFGSITCLEAPIEIELFPNARRRLRAQQRRRGKKHKSEEDFHSRKTMPPGSCHCQSPNRVKTAFSYLNDCEYRINFAAAGSCASARF